MARVRVLAERPAFLIAMDPRPKFSAQVYEDFNESKPVWTCTHSHGSAIDAQLCGVQYLTDRVVGWRRSRPGAA
jgi:hypothetical protein